MGECSGREGALAAATLGVSWWLLGSVFVGSHREYFRKYPYLVSALNHESLQGRTVVVFVEDKP